MNVWFAAALILVAIIAACGVFALRGPRLADAFVALQLAGLCATLLFIVLAIATRRSSFVDLGLVLALVSFPAGVLLVHFLDHCER
jgi:multisubunit Na+/H+ antiporter MnhF subunit